MRRRLNKEQSSFGRQLSTPCNMEAQHSADAITHVKPSRLNQNKSRTCIMVQSLPVGGKLARLVASFWISCG